MIKLQALEPFITYKTRPPVIMPENPKSRKKNMAFMVLAPSIESELKWLDKNPILLFRNLWKYFIDKKWSHSFRGLGLQIIHPDEDGSITNLLNENKTKNLKNIDGVTSYLPNVKMRPLKNFNVLVEANYASEAILNNTKDTRLMSVKTREVISEYTRVYKSMAPGPENYLGDYSCHVIVPMDLYFTTDDYNHIDLIFRPNNREFKAQLIRQLTDPAVYTRFNLIYFIHGSYILLVDTTKLPEDFDMMKKIKEFMMRAKRTRETSTPEELKADAIADQKLKIAEEKSKEELVTDKILTDMNTDPDTVAPEKKAEVKKVVRKNITKTEKPKKEEPEPTLLGQKKQKIDDFEDEIEEPTGEDIVDDEFEMDVDMGEFEMPDVVIEDPEDVDIILGAKATGKTVASYKRDQIMKEKYKESNIGNVPLRTILEAEKKTAIPETKPPIHTINDDMKRIKSQEFEAAYNKNLMMNDLVNILMHFSHVHPAMYINKDIIVEDVSTATDRMIRYTVSFEDETRKRHKFSFLLPKMYEDKYLYLNDQKMNISHQKLPYPVTKISPDSCQAVTSYKKIISSRYGSNLSPRITRIKKLLGGPSCPSGIIVVKGDSTIPNKNYLTTMEYDEIGTVVTKATIGTGKDHTKIFFIVDDASMVIDMKEFKPVYTKHKEDPESLIPLATRSGTKGPTNGGSKFCLSGRTNKVYDEKGNDYGELSEFITDVIGWYDSGLKKELDSLSSGSKFIYSRSRVMKMDVPLVLVCAAADPGGLTAVLQKAKIKFTFLQKKPADYDPNNQGLVQFDDGYLIYDRYPFENSLLLNGLNTFPTKNYSFYDMDTYDAYIQIFDSMFSSKTLADALRNFYYCFIDPITMEVLVRLKMPTDFTRLMLYCNGVLADNHYQIDSDYHNARIRSNEIILAQLYCELAEAWGRYRLGKVDTFSIPENAVIKYLLTSDIVDPHSELNIVLETENDRLIKLKGPSGMNEEHSFTIEKRAYHPSMKGVVGMNSTPSGKVGIGRHMSTNANIDDARGFITVDKEDYTATELATPGELMQAFGPESADIERVAMSLSQSKHVVPVKSSCSCPVSYDAERLMPYLSSDYARSAKQDGKVIDIKNDIMIVQYKDGTYDDVDLSQRPAKNTDGGFYVMNQMVIANNLQIGSEFKASSLLAYDPKYINTNDMFGDYLASMGTMARIAVETNGGVFEDSCYITDDLAHRMATKITMQKRVILSKYANIKSMVKAGDMVKTNSVLISFDDTQDEFTSMMLQTMAAEAGDEDEVIAGTAPVVSKYSGRIADIRIYYTADPNEMTPTLRKIVESYSATNKKREKVIEKYENLYDANTITKPAERLVPDGQGKVKGVKLPDGVMIDFYIEYEDIMAPGDKLSAYTALKGIVSNVVPSDLAPYTKADDGYIEHVDAAISAIGIYKRMCLDIIKVGGMNKIVIEKKRQLANKYLPLIEKELNEYKK